MLPQIACRSVVFAAAMAIGLWTTALAEPAEEPPAESGVPQVQVEDPQQVLSSGPIAPKILRYAEKIIRRYDLNGDGVLTEDEYRAMQGEPHRADLDGDGRITAEEYARRVVEYALRRSLWLVTHSHQETLGVGGPDGYPASAERPRPAGDAAENTAAEADSTAAQGTNRRNRRFYVSGERLRSLPEWFLVADADGDGQLTLEEFTARPPADGPGAFSRYDLDGDGIITPTEYLTAEKRRQEKQADSGSDAADGGRSR